MRSTRPPWPTNNELIYLYKMGRALPAPDIGGSLWDLSELQWALLAALWPTSGRNTFYCEAMPADLLATRGWKRQSGRSANTKGNDNIISNGSIVAVADGQCAMIVEQGKVVDMCAEPGEYTYDTGSAPTLFSGDLSGVHRRSVPEHRQALYLRRRGPDGSAHLLLQHQGAGGQQIRHAQPGALPRGGPAPASTSTLPSAASASTATASPTPFCSTPMSAAMWRKATPAMRSTGS